MMRRNGKEGSSYIPRVERTVWKEEKTREQQISKEKEVEDSGRQKEDKRTLVKVTLTLVFVLCMYDSRL